MSTATVDSTTIQALAEQGSTSNNLEQILNHLPVGIIAVDNSGKVIDVYGSAEKLIRVSKAKICGQMLNCLSDHISILYDLWQKSSTDGRRVSQYDTQLISAAAGIAASDNVVHVDIHVEPLDENKKALIILAPRPNPNTRPKNPFQSPAQKVLGNLSRSLAHEIRNPLTGIKGAAQLLKYSDDGSNEKLANLIQMEVDRISTLVGQLESMSLTPQSERKAANIHQLIEHVRLLCSQQTFSTGQKIGWQLDFDPSLPEAKVGEYELVQVLINLVKNSIEASSEGDIRILIRTRYRHDIKAIDQNGAAIPIPIEIEFEDNGPGVSDSVADHLFEPFISTKEAGQGLGLALSNFYTSWMSGRIQYYKPADGGAGFRINLPLA